MTKRRKFLSIYAMLFMLLLSLTLTLSALGAPVPSAPPDEKRALESESRETGVRINDPINRNEILNESHTAPAAPPPRVSAPPSASPSSGALPPLPPLSGGQAR